MEVDGEFLVFDWGGGTMDATLLLHDEGFFDEKASRGVNRLGGLEIDARLRRMVLDRAPARGRWSDSEKRMFALEIERANILLSHQESVRVQTPDGVPVEIGQDQILRSHPGPHQPGARPRRGMPGAGPDRPAGPHRGTDDRWQQPDPGGARRGLGGARLRTRRHLPVRPDDRGGRGSGDHRRRHGRRAVEHHPGGQHPRPRHDHQGP